MPKRNRQHQQKNESGELAKKGLDQSFRLKKIAPMNDVQSDTFDAYNEKLNLFLYGVAGTGKTFISLYLAIKEVLNTNSPYRKVYIVRSAVPSRDQGYLPGSLKEKQNVYEAPYIAMVNDLFGRGDAYQIASQKGVIELVTTSFLRGVTFDNCILLCDECQNYSFAESDTIITRAGNDCRVMFCGDLTQTDLIKSKYDVSGFPRFFSILEQMDEFEMIEFFAEDIVRSGLCRSYILAKLKMDNPVNNEPSITQ
jgi:phosphate starvation-inducible protein PhoH